MKTLTALAMVLLGSQAFGQMNDTVVAGNYRFRTTHPLGYVMRDEIQTLDNNLLYTEIWNRFGASTPGITQSVDRITSERITPGSWKDTLWQRREWSTNGTETLLECPHYCASRGFNGYNGVGVGVWKDWSGYRYLMITTVRFKVFWTRPSTICLLNGIDQGNNGVSAFEYTLASSTQIDIKIFGSCTISSLAPQSGEPDQSTAYVDITTPMDDYYKRIGRGECYYCNGDKACWWWNPPSPRAASKVWHSGASFHVSFPAPAGAMAEVWRTSDWKNYELLGTAQEEGGTIRYVDSNPPTNQAYYLLNHL